MRRWLCWAGALLWIWAVLPTDVRAATAMHTVSYDSRTLATRLWYPDKLEVIRGVLVFTGGQGDQVSGDTRSIVDDPFWQHFAESVGFALLGNEFQGAYTDAATGPGQGLLNALVGLADKTQHPELAHAPLLLKGFSNGGYFSFTFAHFAPARVIAFCVNKSGYAMAPLDAPFLAIPALLVWGAEEPANNTPTIIHALIQQARPLHALWAEVKEWNAKHEDGAVARLYAPFFAEMIATRYPAATSPRDGDVSLIALTEAAGWLGDHSDASLEADLPLIAPFAEYAGDRQAASWLPSKALATLWRGFVTKNPMGFSSPTEGSVLEVGQPLQLTATGFESTERVRFLVGAAPLAGAISPTVTEASVTWTPSANGVAGLLGLAIDVNGTPKRTTRPVNVVLYTKAPAADAGSGGMAGNGGGGGTAGLNPEAGSGEAGGRDGSQPEAGSGGVGGMASMDAEAGAGGVSEMAGADAEAGAGGDAEQSGSGAPSDDVRPRQPRAHSARQIGPGSTSAGGCSATGRPENFSLLSTWCACSVLLLARRRRTSAVLPVGIRPRVIPLSLLMLAASRSAPAHRS